MQRVRLQLSQPVEALHLLRCLLDADAIRVALCSPPSDATSQASERASGARASGAPASPVSPAPQPPRHAYLFLLQPSVEEAFLGCSPEKLFRIETSSDDAPAKRSTGLALARARRGAGCLGGGT